MKRLFKGEAYRLTGYGIKSTEFEIIYFWQFLANSISKIPSREFFQNYFALVGDFLWC
ncbi:MAG: hypothetical protein LBJ00_12205 [Planctomycetaceae bacterium]|nr:hypothetical protein [Planctomycetaceae bacterium]